MKQPIKTFEPNLKGRDFVIGDLHGALSVLVNLLHNLNFNPEKDRLFSVGDLVDRGPDSAGCLGLLDEPWFHTALSNHEQMMLEAFHGGYMGQFWLQNGGFWGAEALNDYQAWKLPPDDPGYRVPSDESAQIIHALEKIEELPYLITVKLKSGKKVHIIHAELPPGRAITDEDLASPEKVMELATVQTQDGDHMVWGRFLFYNFYRSDLSNTQKIKRMIAHQFGKNPLFNDKLSHIISGHTIVQRPLTIFGQTNIDTAAYDSYPNAYGSHRAWCALTCVELDTWTFYQATEKEFRIVEPLVVNKADVENLRTF